MPRDLAPYSLISVREGFPPNLGSHTVHLFGARQARFCDARHESAREYSLHQYFPVGIPEFIGYWAANIAQAESP